MLAFQSRTKAVEEVSPFRGVFDHFLKLHKLANLPPGEGFCQPAFLKIDFQSRYLNILPTAHLAPKPHHCRCSSSQLRPPTAKG